MNHIQILSINQSINGTQSVIDYNLGQTDWKTLIAFIQELGAKSVVNIATCNRVEIYYEASRDVRAMILDQWTRLSASANMLHLSDITSIYGSTNSLKYLLELSAGFKSVIFGDSQILSQLKGAFEDARTDHRLKSLLERSYQWIMRSHKRICNETDFNTNSVSLAYHALKHISQFSNNQGRLLIIGAGNMAVEVLKYLHKFDFSQITITNRTASKAEYLADKYDIDTIGYGRVDGDNYDYIISCTDNGYELIRNIESLNCYIDLSIGSANLLDIPCHYLSLQSVQSIINKRRHEQLSCTPRVSEILDEQVQSYVEWHHNWMIRSNASKTIRLIA